ncbi:S-adenosyl-L-methionine-dependent methyltransferase [Xylaria bambusicola]|uniref:S-adenosyl-L-methionine-dependent methyltransferase n=1 Tax=Xylaria bambusicola TaxID=326684 RepID=UPI002008C441|nr:S-adenosyl-L-methionine-dependent methyltransferase [Xylaria bambusicola]KAI0517069.1 S-adenosyl-L-methionine-dependent methyltransferase [Xylaria bambusicola]
MEAQSPPSISKLETSVDTNSNGIVNGNVVVSLPSSTLTVPASHFQGFVPPAPEAKERHAVTSLLELLDTDSTDGSSDDYIEFDLTCFSIYIDTSYFHNELRPLQHLISRSVQCMYFDGILGHGDTRFYLRRVPFSKLPVGNYGESNHTVGDQIWVLSKLNDALGRKIYYKLGVPAPEYRRFHLPFLWIVDLSKHVIDYCEHCRDHNHRVTLSDFKSKFSTWLKSMHGSSTVFAKWHAGNRNIDFRVAVSASIDYIWEEAHGLDPEITSWHHIWKEVRTLDYYQPNFSPHKLAGISKTIVTPYVYNLFSHMVFGGMLESRQACVSAEAKKIEFVRQSQSSQPSFTQPGGPRSTAQSYKDKTKLIESIRPGDVISTLPDNNATTDTEWKRESSKHSDTEYHWFGLVQKVHIKPYGKRSFDVLWLYQPIDTPCSVMKYPWSNELFLSDNCTCHHQIAKVQGHEVISTHEVEWFGSPSTSAEFFVRQTYVASDCRWMSLRKEHFVCDDETAFSQEPHQSYVVGDTVLVATNSMQLETFVIEYYLQDPQYARMRRLWRRKDVDKDARSAPPNELVYSEHFVDINTKRIDRRFIVRAFEVDEEIPPPYNRNGSGDAFFITHKQVQVEGVTEYRPLGHTHSELFRQGFSHNKTPKLRGLDLFCGGGNFGRGIEDGDAVEMRWCNDLWEGAIHSYMANADHERCAPFLGSVDELLAHALSGDPKVPAPGEVEFISAGSPCPGFSLLTVDKTTDRQRKNQSLVASFASFVELYRPLYGVLENVPTMVNTSSLRHSCVFSQLVCALVGLGYQVQVFFLDAWSFGSAQSRSRVFLTFTAPGLRTPKAPNASHSHPEKTQLQKLGEMSCGRPFDSRKTVPTPFKFISIKEAVGDLPDVQDAKADYCVGYPDHRLSMGYTPQMRLQLQYIPTHPYKMNFVEAWKQGNGVMTATERLLFPEEGKERTKIYSKGWGRVDPNGLVGTLSTTCAPTDARIGRINHWEQNRPMTIMEARRAQGFLDHEVIVGNRADQYKVIGNSVSRHVALVLGLAIREAWIGTLLDEDLGANMQPQTLTTLDMTYTDSSEEVLTMSTPCSLGTFTPATSESTDVSDGEIHRKRSQSIYIELAAKKRRLITDGGVIKIE